MLRSLREIGRVQTLRCRDHSELMSRVLDGRSSRGTMAGLRVHFTVCPGCRRLWRRLRLVEALAAAMNPASRSAGPARAGMPAPVRGRIDARLRRASDRLNS